VTADRFRRLALGLADATEGAHMGHPDFRAGGRIFATLHAGGRTGMVKLAPEQQAEFTLRHPEAFSPESGAWGRAGCTRVSLAMVGEDALGEALTLARQNIARPAGPGARRRRVTAIGRRRIR
jgi:hypothetical protein